VYAYNRFATSCGFMFWATRPAAVSSAAHVLPLGIRPNIAYAQVKVATACAFMFRATRLAAVSRAAHVLLPGTRPNFAMQ